MSGIRYGYRLTACWCTLINDTRVKYCATYFGQEMARVSALGLWTISLKIMTHDLGTMFVYD